MSRASSVALQVGAWTALLAAVAVVGGAVIVPRVSGATPYTVLTGSMEPTMPAGTMVVVKPAAPEEIEIGTVITYQVESGEPTMVTHRVIAQGFDGQGEPIFQSQGDANDVPDAEWVRPVQIQGEQWYALPYLGYASQLLTGQQRQIGVYVVAAWLLAYALMMVVSGVRDRRGIDPETGRAHG